MNPELISVRESDNNIVKLECYNRLDSTVKLARAYARDGYPDRYAVVAEYLGGSDDRGIHMSIILRPSIFPSQAGLLSSLASVALVTALEDHTSKRLGIGWVSKNSIVPDLYSSDHVFIVNAGIMKMRIIGCW